MSAALEQLVVLAVREFQQARMSLEQASVLLDMVRSTLDPDAQDRVADLTAGWPSGEGGGTRPGVSGERDDGSSDRPVDVACPACGLPLAHIDVFGGTAWLCPDHGEVDPEAPGDD